VVFVALLRAINLGKVNRVPMGDLRTVLTDAGFTDVRTHLQSGNVVLASTKRSPGAVERAVEELVEREFGVQTSVMVRTGSAMKKIAAGNPFAKRGADPRQLFVAFLKQAPTAAATRALGGRAFGDDDFAVRGSEIFLRYPRGVAGSTMSTPVFEKTLGSPGTVRTWNVVTRVAELAAGTA
jgi:uncharacterized protein (DUF1697 family)